MPDRHVEMFEAVAGSVLSELDYPRLYPSPGLVSADRGVPRGPGDPSWTSCLEDPPGHLQGDRQAEGPAPVTLGARAAPSVAGCSG